MTSHSKKEDHLQGCYDQGFYDLLVVAKNPFCVNQNIFDSACVGGDGVPATPEKEIMANQAPLESPSLDNAPSTADVCEAGQFMNGQFNMVQYGEKSTGTKVGAARKRKRQPADVPSEEGGEFKSHLFSMLQTSSAVLTAHVESQNVNSRLDREQRKEQMESLVGVLNKLADSLGKIAERL
ncbi:hypothetical protein GOP47_0003066 [Adiantum capillus-veneris]|uniref:Uncharacterized protein n=1 Tax=Adiantum capillus-veneris TaxID=13818 RepID=A0A9D4VBR1_ADICA|nr:hypothetical protein GOP47_0003066 [Adiantum capillus-veneris]